MAQKPETGETSYQEVVKTFVREVDQVVYVVGEGTEIQTTKEHPFYVEGEGFVRAGSLRSGDVLRLADGENATVWKVWSEALDEKVRVYNFEVADCHTYYVSELGVLVHNVCAVNGNGIWNGNKEIYSVVFEVQLPNGMYPDVSDVRHFQEANRQLNLFFKQNPDIAKQMEKLYPGIIDGVKPGPRGAYSRKAPTRALTWHHVANRKGILQLVLREQHEEKGKIQSVLHPNGKGGMQIWGGGRKRKL